MLVCWGLLYLASKCHINRHTMRKREKKPGYIERTIYFGSCSEVDLLKKKRKQAHFDERGGLVLGVYVLTAE